MISIGSLQMCFSLNALATQIRLQSVLCVLRNVTQRQREIQTDGSYVVTDTYVVTTATHADRRVMSGHMCK